MILSVVLSVVTEITTTIDAFYHPTRATLLGGSLISMAEEGLHFKLLSLKLFNLDTTYFNMTLLLL